MFSHKPLTFSGAKALSQKKKRPSLGMNHGNEVRVTLTLAFSRGFLIGKSNNILRKIQDIIDEAQYSLFQMIYDLELWVSSPKPWFGKGTKFEQHCWFKINSRSMGMTSLKPIQDTHTAAKPFCQHSFNIWSLFIFSNRSNNCYHMSWGSRYQLNCSHLLLLSEKSKKLSCRLLFGCIKRDYLTDKVEGTEDRYPPWKLRLHQVKLDEG